LYKILKLLAVSAILIIASSAHGQRSDEQQYSRWLSKKPVIKAIDIELAKDNDGLFSPGKIEKSLFSKKSSVWGQIRANRRRRVQRETIMRDTSEVKYLYLSNGYLDVLLAETVEIILPDSTARIKITIDERQRYYYDTVLVSGQYQPGLYDDFLKLARHFKKHKPVDPFKLKQAEYDMKTILANNGYPYASVNYSINKKEDDSLVVVDFDIISDSLVYFGEVKIDGADKFDNSLVRRELTLKRGDLYRRIDIIRTQKRLLETGYYFTLRLNSTVRDTSSLESKLNPDFLLTLKEKKPHHFSFKTGAAQDSIKDLTWSFSGAWSKRNFFRSRYLELSTKTSFVIFTQWRLKEHSYRLRVTEPWFLGLRMPLTLTGQIEPGVRSLLQPYRKQSWFISASTIWNIRDNLKLLTGLQYEEVNIYGVSREAEAQIKEEEGISVRRKYYLNIVRDSRDNLFVPTRGSVTSIRFEYIGGFLGGDDSFYQLEGSWSRYHKVWPGWISATRIKSGFLQEIGDSEAIPTDDRYYIGGANSIRGFAENELGPQTEAGNFSGADIILILNQEFRYPIVGKIWGSLFADAGNGYIRRKDIKVKNLAFSYGLGIQFLSPAGPIRLDYARHIGTEGIQPGDKVHFTILYAF